MAQPAGHLMWTDQRGRHGHRGGIVLEGTVALAVQTGELCFPASCFVVSQAMVPPEIQAQGTFRNYLSGSNTPGSGGCGWLAPPVPSSR